MEAGKRIQPGCRGLELAAWMDNFRGEILPGSCIFSLDINVNEQVCHYPPTEKKLKEGDVLTMDLVIRDSGLYADGAWTFLCGGSCPEDRELIRGAWNLSKLALDSVQEGTSSFQMKKNIHDFLRTSPFSLVSEACGHGISRRLHEPPDIHYALLHPRDILWKEGMTFTVEPVLARGNGCVRETLRDMYVISNGEKSAYFEHMAYLSPQGPVCLNFPELGDESIDIFSVIL